MVDPVEGAKVEFQRLMAQNRHSEMVDLLVSLRAQVKLSPEDEGWAQWNICDRLALLGDPIRQYGYQVAFAEWLRDTFPAERLHWVVSDSTQAMNLMKGGFVDFWTTHYRYANERAPKIPENRVVRFESHRAVAAAYTHGFRDLQQALEGLRAIEDVIAEDPEWPNRDFATITLETLYVDFLSVSGETEELAERMSVVDRHLERWLDSYRAEPEDYVNELGTWADRNKVRPPSSVLIALNNAACVMARARQFPHAEKLFRSMLARGRRIPTPYSQTQFLLSCWENRHDETEVRELMSGMEGLTQRHLTEWAPELHDALFP